MMDDRIMDIRKIGSLFIHHMPHLLYITCPTPEEARNIARTLVLEKLIACANVLPGATSIFRWKGEIQEAQETVLIAKTSRDALEKAQARILALHSYDCPCIVALPIEAGNPDFLKWVEESVAL